MSASAGVEIRAWSVSDSIAQLTALLHRAYAELGAQGLRFTAVDQSEAKTRERIAKGRCFVAVSDGAVVGTVTYYPPGANLDSAWYRRPGVAVFGQFGVDPARRGKRIGTSLLNYVESVARADAATELALDTAEDAVALVEMYARMGFQIVDRDDCIVPAYRSVVMTKKLN